MLLKNLATVSFGVLLSLKALADDKELYGADLTRIESNKNKLSDEKSDYRIVTAYRAEDFFAFDAAAIGPASQKTAIFGSNLAPDKLQGLVELSSSDAYVFTAALSMPEKNPGTVQLAEEQSIP
ncbi:hypothetical protein SOP85_12570 [Pseudomonas sp. YuFO20]|uniref:hypothetical protein n=1 Tax=Pseudomonas TaxID=286 RepID=UPI002363492C|nr:MULTISPECIES: hypothetical protein [Pseudomonas]MDD2102481.1 hypothetical protein [Pseudomonas putida]MEB2516270.1 hypothetical protein [Pseudomonas sp. YuFO20]